MKFHFAKIKAIVKFNELESGSNDKAVIFALLFELDLHLNPNNYFCA